MALTTGQQTVLTTLRQFGQATDPALATYIHHMAEMDMSSSGVRTRRHELAQKGYVEPVAVKRMKSGRSSAVWSLTAKGRKAADKLTVAQVAV